MKKIGITPVLESTYVVSDTLFQYLNICYNQYELYEL